MVVLTSRTPTLRSAGVLARHRRQSVPARGADRSGARRRLATECRHRHAAGGEAPDSVLNAVVARLGAMPTAGAVASAVAVLGDAAPLAQVATFARLDLDAVSRAADLLVGRPPVSPGRAAVVRAPLIASAVRTSMSPLDRDEAHRRAASILREEGASDEAIRCAPARGAAGSDSSAVGGAAVRRAQGGHQRRREDRGPDAAARAGRAARGRAVSGSPR